MAIMYPKSIPSNRSAQLLKEWLKQVDTNGDGRISKKELEEALGGLGIWFPGLRARHAIKNADINGNHLIDGDYELSELAEYVRRRWGNSICR